MFTVLSALAGLVCIVCWILVLIPLFHESVGKGIFGIICGLYTFIWGWQHVGEDNRRPIMIAWTAGIIVSIVANAVVRGAAA